MPKGYLFLQYPSLPLCFLFLFRGKKREIERCFSAPTVVFFFLLPRCIFCLPPPPSCRPFLPLFSCCHKGKKRNRGTKNWGQQREGRPRNEKKPLSLTPICQKLNDRFLTYIITDGLSERGGRNRQQRPNDAISGGAVIGGPGHGHRTGKITLLLLLAKWEILIRYNKNSSRMLRKKNYSSHDNF